MIVAIDGVDGSGKSRLADALAAALGAGGAPVTVVHVDDFRRPLDLGGLDAAAETDAYYDRYYDFAAAGQALAAAARAGTAILEGVMLLRVPLPADSWLVVLEVTAEEARRRILARDRAKGRSPEEVSRRIDRRYFPAQERYRAAHDPGGRAHALIDNDDWRRPRLLRRAMDLPPRLAAALAGVLGAAA
ncbi:MAG TPA: AAA family ATPase [Polyangia bacterium]|nr:AAA family ATPase [Polyangia bacterium]